MQMGMKMEMEMEMGMVHLPVPSPMENVRRPKKRPPQILVTAMTGMILPMTKRSGHKDLPPVALTTRIRERDQSPEDEIP